MDVEITVSAVPVPNGEPDAQSKAEVVAGAKAAPETFQDADAPKVAGKVVGDVTVDDSSTADSSVVEPVWVKPLPGVNVVLVPPQFATAMRRELAVKLVEPEAIAVPVPEPEPDEGDTGDAPESS